MLYHNNTIPNFNNYYKSDRQNFPNCETLCSLMTNSLASPGVKVYQSCVCEHEGSYN